MRMMQLWCADTFLGRSLVGRISQGTAKANQQIKAINLKGEKVDEGRWEIVYFCYYIFIFNV